MAPLLLAGACGSPERGRVDGARAIAFERVTVVDVERGQLLRDRTVLVRGDRIATVDSAPRVRVPGSARRVDGRGMFLIPGFWDMHSHVDDGGAWIFPASVAMGVVGLRDLGSGLAHLAEWRAEAARGALVPRIVAAGPIVMGLSRDPDPRLVAVRTAADGERVVDSLARAGVDLIKVYDWVPRDAYLAIARAARARNLPLAGHLPVEVDPATAVAAGQRSIEHDGNAEGGLLLYASRDAERYVADARALVGRPFDPSGLVGSWPPAKLDRLLRSYDDTKAARIARELGVGGVFVTPTVYSYSTVWLLAPDSALLHDPARELLPPSLREAHDAMVRDYYRAPPTPEAAAVRSRLYETRARLVRTLARAGVPLLAGSDLSPYPGGFPGYALHRELEELVAVGLSPIDALRAATLNPARYFAATDTMGTVAPGNVADLVLLGANPLAAITNTRRVEAVMLRGRLIDSAGRAALLGEARRRAR